MIGDVTIRVSDLGASARFYATVLAALGVPTTAADALAAGGRVDFGGFALVAADGDHPPTRALHVGFAASSCAAVDAFWEAGVAAGHRDDGPPGPRPRYTADYYGAFLLDPDGNSAEAAHHAGMRGDGLVDHLWLRVADIAASRRFYVELASNAALRLVADTPELIRLAASPDPTRSGGSLTFVAGSPRTEHAAIALTGRTPTRQRDPDGHAISVVAG